VRSIDLFLVSRKWAAAYLAASDVRMRAEIADQIQTWNDAVGAFYYALLGGHLLSAVCFAIATWDRERLCDRAVSLGFVATALECASRMVEGYVGQTWLSSINYAAYLPVVLFNFGTLAVWLWCQGSSFRATAR
jgi:hypothetical protein